MTEISNTLQSRAESSDSPGDNVINPVLPAEQQEDEVRSVLLAMGAILTCLDIYGLLRE